MRAGRNWKVWGLATVLSLSVAPFALQGPGWSSRHTASDALLDGGEALAATFEAMPVAADELWLVPSATQRIEFQRVSAIAGLTRGVSEYNAGNYDEALPLVSSAGLTATPLADYALYYTALTNLQLDRESEARRQFAELAARAPAGFLAEAALVGQAAAAEEMDDFAAAAAIYDTLTDRRTTLPEDVALGLARAAEGMDDRDRARAVLLRLFYEHPLSGQAETARKELHRLGEPMGAAVSAERLQLELGRAERLYAVRRYGDARQVYQDLRSHATGEDRALVGLRLAEIDYHYRRYRTARTGLAPFQKQGPHPAEARYYYLSATRELGSHAEYIRLSRALVADFPDSSWAEDALNNLASHHIRNNEDALADQVFREMSEKFPDGRHAERAAWKSGWWAYKNGNYRESARIFEAAAARFARSDYRPAYLYWAARSRDRLQDRQAANERYALVTTDYLNSYYGRLASELLGRRNDSRSRGVRMPVEPVATTGSSESGSLVPEPQMPANAGVIRHLLAADLLDDALRELTYASRVWAETPVLGATRAWIYGRQGDHRRGIIEMKRAYPGYLAAGGESLPEDLLKVVFPIDYWPLIRSHAVSRSLDPYLMAALVAQESTFVADIRSSANAIGLMQIIPSTGRRYARILGVRRFTTSMLRRPEINVNFGTAYYADLIRRFDHDHLALASYNAGEHRVVRWLAERPGLDRDEFIDDIPFPETQNYVKKVLGMAEDYRRLYGDGARSAS